MINFCVAHVSGTKLSPTTTTEGLVLIVAKFVDFQKQNTKSAGFILCRNDGPTGYTEKLSNFFLENARPCFEFCIQRFAPRLPSVDLSLEKARNDLKPHVLFRISFYGNGRARRQAHRSSYRCFR